MTFFKTKQKRKPKVKTTYASISKNDCSSMLSPTFPNQDRFIILYLTFSTLSSNRSYIYLLLITKHLWCIYQ